MDSLDQTVDAPRAATTREWEVFCRESASEPLVHVGSVSAPTATVAREQAASLFEHAARALWLCPADETVRVQAADLGVGTSDGDEGTPAESAGASAKTRGGEG